STTLRPAGELERLGMHLDLLTGIDEERDTELESGLEHRQFRDASARGVSANARFRRRDRELDVRWELKPDGVAVVTGDLEHQIVDEQPPIVADAVGAERDRVERFLIE